MYLANAKMVGLGKYFKTRLQDSTGINYDIYIYSLLVSNNNNMHCALRSNKVG